MFEYTINNNETLILNTIISDEDKDALTSGHATIETKILIKSLTDNSIDKVLTEKDCVKSWNIVDERYVPDNGFLGQFVAKTIDGELHNMEDDFNIEDREIIITMGITSVGESYSYLITENTNNIITTENGDGIVIASETEVRTNWYQLGTYIVTKPEDDEVSDNTSFEGMDYAVLFNKDFDANYIDDNWNESFNDIIRKGNSISALSLAKYTCSQVGIEFGNISFTNSDFVIDTNQFTTGQSCRDVMKNIAQLAYGWVNIDWDNKCYITELEMNTMDISKYNIIDNDHYYSLTTQKNNYGPINQIVVGMSSINGNEGIIRDLESINNVGLNELDIYDNVITYTKELRDEAVKGAERLLGLEYAPFETETPGHPWLKGNELIRIDDMENNPRFTYPFNRTIKYTGHIKTDLSSVAETSKARAVGYNVSLYKTVKDLSITIDNQNGVIKTLNSNIQAANDGLSSLETRFENEITDTYSKTEIQEIVSGIGVDGTVVSSVKSTAGVFDKDGLTIEQSEADTKTNINANGMIIYNKTGGTDDPLLTVNANGVIAKNVAVETYLNIGTHSRFEDYSDSETNVTGTGVFWIGDDF